MMTLTMRQVAQIYRQRLKQRGVSIKFVVPTNQPRNAANLKMWRIEGHNVLLSDNQLFRLATKRCPECKNRFLPEPGPGRERVYCGRSCQNRAHYKRKTIKND